MTTDPSYELQRSVYQAITAVTDDAVVHEVDANQQPPYIKIGDDIIDAEFDAGEFYACTVNVHVFERTTPKVKQVAGLVTKALAIDLPVVGFATCESHYVQTVYSTEPDGMTKRAWIELMYLLQPA
jgi:hypothetical protein